MNRCIHVLIAMAIVGLQASQRSSAGDGKTELEGTWNLVALEADGKELKLPKDAKMITTGNKFVLKAGDKTIVAGTFKLDPSKKPKTIDMTYAAGPDKGKSFKGIYEVKGDVAKFSRPLDPEGERRMRGVRRRCGISSSARGVGAANMASPTLASLSCF